MTGEMLSGEAHDEITSTIHQPKADLRKVFRPSTEGFKDDKGNKIDGWIPTCVSMDLGNEDRWTYCMSNAF